MRRLRRHHKLATVLIALFISGAALAAQPDEILADPALEARARAISRELRCVVCQSESIDDSNAPLARDLRLLVRERISAGDSDAAVRAYVVERYGDYVLLKPPVQANTLALWLTPVLLFLIAGIVAAIQLRRSAAAPAPPQPLTPEEQTRLRELGE